MGPPESPIEKASNPAFYPQPTLAVVFPRGESTQAALLVQLSPQVSGQRCGALVHGQDVEHDILQLQGLSSAPYLAPAGHHHWSTRSGTGHS